MLRAGVRHLRYLSDDQLDRLKGFVRILIAEKDWVGMDGLNLTDEIQVVIAGHAGLLTLGFGEPYYFDRLYTIIVHPREFITRRSRLDVSTGLDTDEERLGEAWHRGPIILSWQAIRDTTGVSGSNLVIHEFAHHVDSLGGTMDGVPPLANPRQEQHWQQTMEREFHRLLRDARSGEATLLDQYGATHPAEFFAVASECFFEKPRAMRARHEALYRMLAEFYQQDVAAWLPDADQPQ
jgi:Mlc titration factor MtfA (ptsG expression regulator)